MLRNADFYSEEDWKSVALTPSTQDLLGRRGQLTYDDTTLLNRRLLEAAFPQWIKETLLEPTFEGREVVLGPRAGDYYIVLSGLGEGERVVTRGNFKIDSTLQLQAKPSMMYPKETAASQEGGEPSPAKPGQESQPAPAAAAPEAFRTQLGAVIQKYFGLTAALAADDFEKASAAAKEVQSAAGTVDMTLLPGPDHERWMKELPNLKAALDRTGEAKDIESLRGGFALLSDELAVLVRTFGVGPGVKAVYRLHCPMAFNNRGADWLQPDKTTHNPYFGVQMPSCGNIVETLVEGK
jgi:Cu(I)/Ag(I) efflux system membrane fusion protein